MSPLGDLPREWRRGEYVVSTDRARPDLGTALTLLRDTHRGGALSVDTLERAVRHSVVFGVYAPSWLIGLARVVTDLATYGYLTDVVIAPAHRFTVAAGPLVYMERAG